MDLSRAHVFIMIVMAIKTIIIGVGSSGCIHKQVADLSSMYIHRF